MSSLPNDPRVSLTPRAAQIAQAARELLEEQGVEALSMRNIAARLGIRAASLYEHFADKRAVEGAIIAAGLYEQGDFVSARLVDTTAPRTHTIAHAYRDFALAHPALYRLMMGGPIDRSAPDVAGAERYATAAISADPADVSTSLALWAFLHGVVDLELNQRFATSADVDAVWESGLAAICTQLADGDTAATV